MDAVSGDRMDVRESYGKRSARLTCRPGQLVQPRPCPLFTVRRETMSVSADELPIQWSETRPAKSRVCARSQLTRGRYGIPLCAVAVTAPLYAVWALVLATGGGDLAAQLAWAGFVSRAPSSRPRRCGVRTADLAGAAEGISGLRRRNDPHRTGAAACPRRWLSCGPIGQRSVRVPFMNGWIEQM
jgi:hypothetical protein